MNDSLISLKKAIGLSLHWRNLLFVLLLWSIFIMAPFLIEFFFYSPMFKATFSVLFGIKIFILLYLIMLFSKLIDVYHCTK